MVVRDRYVLRVTEENLSKKRRIVYMDESYIHKNYCHHEDSLFDPNDEQDLNVAVQHKGQRYCFIAEIIGAEESVDPMERIEEEEAGLLHETLHIFQGGKRQTKDYHGMFDFGYFIDWMKNLIVALKHRGSKNCIIIMDNAVYHKKLPPDTPRSGSKKKDLKEACVRYGLSYSDNESKSIIWERLKLYVDANILPVVCTMAHEAGHEVLFTPPTILTCSPLRLYGLM